MMLVDCLIYTVLTFLIPFRLTYKSFKQPKNLTALNLWSNYWAIFTFVKLLQCQISFLTYQPMRIVLLVFHLWLYYEHFRGALVLSALAHKKISEIGFLCYIDIIAQNLKIQDLFGVEDSKIKQQAVTVQTKKQQ